MKTDPQKVAAPPYLSSWKSWTSPEQLLSLFFSRFTQEQAKSLKDEGNAFFKEKDYQKAILCYTAGLKKKCGDQEINTVLLTNRAAAHFHLGEELCLYTCRYMSRSIR